MVKVQAEFPTVEWRAVVVAVAAAAIAAPVLAILYFQCHYFRIAQFLPVVVDRVNSQKAYLMP